MSALSWEEFERRLAAALEAMGPETFLIVTLPPVEGGTAYYVQFARFAATEDAGEGLRAEAVGNEHLPPSAALTTRQVQRLRRLGWLRPGPADKGRNHTRSWAIPAPYADVARLAIATLRDVYAIDEPGHLRYVYQSFERRPVGALDLGIEPQPRAPSRPGRPRPGRAAEELRPLVEKALMRWLRLPELVRDEDGDYPVRLGSALLFVRLADGVPPVVRIFAAILRDVPDSPALLAALNQVNSQIRFGRTFWASGNVYVSGEVSAVGITGEQLRVVCTELANLADHLDDGFHGRFGGALMFETQPGLVN